MSNFAERLVARGAGAPLPGISSLVPRPVARFEPVAAIDIAEAAAFAPAERPSARPIGAETEAKIDPAAARNPGAFGERSIAGADTQIGSARERTSIENSEAQHVTAEREIARPRAPESSVRKPKHPPNILNSSLQAQAAQGPPSNSGETAPKHVIPAFAASEFGPMKVGTPTQRAKSAEAPITTLQRLVRADIEASPPDRRSPTEQVAPPAAFVQPREFRAVGAEQRLATPPARAAMVGEEKAEQAPAPVISIGKIEVQFLPQEPRLPAPRLEPQRTRGFEAYARARRGEPR
jgi:hypothetical protein